MANLHQRSKRKRGVTLSPIGWQRLQSAQATSERKANHTKPYTLEDLNEITGLSPHTLTKIRRRKAPVDKRSLEDYFSAFNLTLTLSDYLKPTSATQIQKEKIIPIQQDWGEAIDVSIFYGRIKELATLEKWIEIDRCRLVAVLGMGGIGKTALAVKIAQQLQEQFEYVIWRSLRNAPPLENLLGELIPFISAGQETQTEIKVLIQYLRSSRSLIVLDNVETILQPGECAGQYRTGYENYGQLFKLIGETAHSSCLMLTSREKPAEVAALEGIDLSVHSLQLTGSLSAAKALLEAKGLSGSEAQQQQLCARYGNNPLALKIVATSIQDLFAGDIGAFLAEDVTVFNSIQKLLERQFERLSPLEQTIMYWLAINREWTTIAELLEDIVPAVSRGNLLEALESLIWRSPIEQQAGSYTQQPVVMEYVTERLIERITEEIITQSLHLFCSHALIKAQTKNYLRSSQINLILQPIVDRLLTTYANNQRIVQQLTEILASLRQKSSRQPGYAAGNLLNLLCHLNVDLTGKCDKTLLGHTNTISSLAINPQETLLASGGSDQTVRMWSLSQCACIRTIQGTINWISSVAFSPDGTQVVSGSEDRIVRVWSVNTGNCLILRGHQDVVHSVAFSPDGSLIASSSIDNTVKLWDVGSRDEIETFRGHTAPVYAVKFNPNGRVLASGGHNRNVLLWDVKTASVIKTLPAHHCVQSVTFSPDGKLLAVGAFDAVVKLWNLETEQCCQTFSGHTYWAWAVAISPDGSILASGSHDRTVRLWDIRTGKCLHLLEGHSGWIWSVAFSPDGRTLASASSDCTIKLWDVSTGSCLLTLKEHNNWVMSVAFSPQGDTLVSGSSDETIKLWNRETGICQQTWRVERFYEGMKIRGATGLSEAQKATLCALGAIDHEL